MPALFARYTTLVALSATLLPSAPAQQAPPARPHHNVIVFVADGLRRGSVNERDMPAFFRVRTQGTDLLNSHAVFPTFTTANASVIATGHGLGDTGDFSNTLYPGAYLAPMSLTSGTGTVTPFLESNEVLASLNALFNGNYLGETTLLSWARTHNVNVAAIGKVGPVGIQQVDQINWDHDTFALTDATMLDDQTGTNRGVPLPFGFSDTLNVADLAAAAPTRSNGYPDGSLYSNATNGDAATSGTKAANITQQQWEADVTTHVLLPRFAATTDKPFLLLFWARDPDGTQHNQGDGFNPNSARYSLQPGINGETSAKALHNVDRSLKQILDWLDANPEIKATTDVLLTSDHGFATISRRDIDAKGHLSGSPAKTPDNELTVKTIADAPGTLPPGFLAMDLALFTNGRLFDASAAGITGDSVFPEVLFRDKSPRPHPSLGNALIGMPEGKPVRKLDGTDAQMIVAANGGSDLIYVPSGDPAIVQRAIAILSDFDYVSGLFVDDKYCPTPTSCPGALRLSDIGLMGSTKMPRPAIVVNFKVFYTGPTLQDAVQISDTTLQHGQGMHGGFGRESTWNNMAAIGPDFRAGFVDNTPVGNIDIAPTIASILGLDMPSVGTLRGRVMSEMLASSTASTATAPAAPLVSAPAKNGRRTVVELQEVDGHRYFDRGCMVDTKAKETCAP